MSAEKDLQELLRLLTTTRKLPILQAMTQVKALQTAGLKSIQQIADAPADQVKEALGDAAAAKALQTSCKTSLKKGSKRPAEGDSTPKKKSRGALYGDDPMTPAELEQSLALPVFVPESKEEEQKIADTVILTNRAPLVLAFTVELLRYTMPEQPVSSRLSLAQAVVSANSRTKAASLGLAPEVEEDGGWGSGQPRIRVMGREISVLKRSGYTWKGDEEVGEAAAEPVAESEPAPAPTTTSTTTSISAPKPTWSVSQTITIKDSTFVARATTMTDASQRAALMRTLMERHPSLMSASHNSWSYRVKSHSKIQQDCFDDGETACGELMLRVMAEVGAVDTLVVLTRWFGGTLLGPDRFRLMRNCVTGVLSERLRLSGAEVALSGEAAWGLDSEAMSKSQTQSKAGSRETDVGMPIHRPEGARQYLLKSFPSYEAKEKKTIKAADAEKEENLSYLLGALRIVYDSWADHISAAELDRRAWGWYVAVRPEVEAGPAGWGAKGAVKLSDILKLRRPE